MDATKEESQNPEVAMHTVASAPGGNSVSALVAKSKKAASSLFTLLHAKVRQPVWFFPTPWPCLTMIAFKSSPFRTVNSEFIDARIQAAPKQN